jgi:2-methylcitrate dehydratase PrpD
MREHRVAADQVAKVVTQVHQGAIDVLGPVVDPQTVHQAKFSMGTVLGLVAVKGFAGLTEFDADYKTAPVVAFREKVSMVLDAEVDSAYPARWIGKVQVTTTDGRQLAARVDEPKGDPGNTLSRAELEDKAQRLAAYRGGATAAEMQGVIAQVWGLAQAVTVPRFLA